MGADFWRRVFRAPQGAGKESNMKKDYELTPQQEYWVSEDGLTLVEAWARDGLTQAQIAERMGIDSKTLSVWKKQIPELAEAMRVGKELLDYRVENALLKCALGYKTKEIKVTLGKKMVGGEAFQVLKETTEKEVGPNAVACLAWLNNRKHEQWKRNRDRCEDYTEQDSNVTVTILRGKDDGLGDSVNKGVKVDVRKKPVEVTDEDNEKASLDSWPDDWEEG